MRRLVAIAGALSLACSAALYAEASEQTDNWSETVERFEEFVRNSKQTMQPSGLEILETGEIIHSVRIPTFDRERSENTNATTHRLRLAPGLGINFYVEGASVLGKALKEPHSTLWNQPAPPGFLPTGTYTAFLESIGPLGYQVHYPIIRFEMLPEQNEGPVATAMRGNKIRMIGTLDGEADQWPNERLLRFHDFFNFRKKDVESLREKNDVFDPSLELKLAAAGSISREPLSPKKEAMLHWRIYHNGKLKESGAAGGVLEWTPSFGEGTYSVWLGVEGPGGFIPVSNHLCFPLFQHPDGSFSTLMPPYDEAGEPATRRLLRRQWTHEFWYNHTHLASLKVPEVP